ncbi:MAG: diiron oxygenase [Pseudomonadota bacterium]|nr:diiron oxygenase [Pseudomonadota bacterium]
MRPQDHDSGAPRHIIELDASHELPPRTQQASSSSLGEGFRVRGTCRYTWDYRTKNERIGRLVELSRGKMPNIEADFDWTLPVDRQDYITEPMYNAFRGFSSYEALSEAERIRFDWHMHAHTCSNFLHGTQGAMLVAAQIVASAPSYEAKLYAAYQTHDEALHLELLTTYLERKVGYLHPINAELKAILDRVLGEERWYLKVVGMQLIIEGLAVGAFSAAQMTCRDRLFRSICHRIIPDEARHVTYGVHVLEQVVHSLSRDEREAAALLAFEMCASVRERLVATSVFDEFGWDPEEARLWQLNSQVAANFRSQLFTRIMPNLKRVGLLTPKAQPQYEQLGLLAFVTPPQRNGDGESRS